MSGDLDRLLTEAAATPTRPVDVEALHARAQRAQRRNRIVVGMSAVVLLIAGTAAVLTSTGDDQRVELAPADAPSEQDAPGGQDVSPLPEIAVDPLHVVLSHQQVASTGQTITLAVVNGSETDFSYGADGVLRQWDGTEWVHVADVTLSRTWWERGGSVSGPGGPDIDVPDIDYTATSDAAGEPEWLTLPALEPGWYQLARGSEPQATAVFHVVTADDPLEPVLAVPWEDPYLSLNIAAIGPTGGLLDMVPAEGTDVAGGDADGGEGSAQLSRWQEDAWSPPQTAIVQLQPEEPVDNVFAVRADIPPLEPGFWRVQIDAADGGQLTGYLWILKLASEGHPDTTPPPDANPEDQGTDPTAVREPPWTVLAADVATTDGVRVAARSANELTQAWAAASASTDPPTVAPDNAVVVVSVPSSTCRAPSDVLGVEVTDRTIVVVLDEEGEFTRPCPGPSETPRGTVFAIAVPLDAVPEDTDVLTRTAPR